MTARQECELEKTAAAVKLAGAEPLVYALDLSEPSSVEIIVNRTSNVLAWDALKASNGSVVLISGSAALDPKSGLLKSPQPLRT